MFHLMITGTTGRRTGAALATAVGGVLLLSACGGSQESQGSHASQKPAKKPSASAKAGGKAQHTELASRRTELGTVLTDGKGFTLYTFDKDSTDTSACAGKCAGLWPPATGTPHAAEGVELPGRLGHFTRADGTVQVSYDGRPVYRFAKDTQPGQTTGDGVKGTWHVVKPTSGE